jgi:hypothetical protein
MMKKTCPVCQDIMVRVEDIASAIDGQNFTETGYRCLSCGEEFIPKSEDQKIIKSTRKMKVWGKP